MNFEPGGGGAVRVEDLLKIISELDVEVARLRQENHRLQNEVRKAYSFTTKTLSETQSTLRKGRILEGLLSFIRAGLITVAVLMTLILPFFFVGTWYD